VYTPEIAEVRADFEQHIIDRVITIVGLCQGQNEHFEDLL